MVEVEEGYDGGNDDDDDDDDESAGEDVRPSNLTMRFASAELERVDDCIHSTASPWGDDNGVVARLGWKPDGTECGSLPRYADFDPSGLLALVYASEASLGPSGSELLVDPKLRSGLFHGAAPALAPLTFVLALALAPATVLLLP